jgi:hypothetical protein
MGQALVHVGPHRGPTAGAQKLVIVPYVNLFAKRDLINNSQGLIWNGVITKINKITHKTPSSSWCLV